MADVRLKKTRPDRYACHVCERVYAISLASSCPKCGSPYLTKVVDVSVELVSPVRSLPVTVALRAEDQKP